MTDIELKALVAEIRAIIPAITHPVAIMVLPKAADAIESFSARAEAAEAKLADAELEVKEWREQFTTL